MRKATAQAFLAIHVILLVAAAIAWAGSQGGRAVGTVPVWGMTTKLALALGVLLGTALPSALG